VHKVGNQPKKKFVFALLQPERYLESTDHPILLLVAYPHVCVCACVRARPQLSPITNLRFLWMETIYSRTS